MICIKCHQPTTSVINSRPHKKQSSVWRRRHCNTCDTTFTTLESTASGEDLMIISGKERAPFSIPRLSVNLCSYLNVRPTAADDAYWLAHTIFEKLFSQNQNESSVDTLKIAAYETLERFDPVAALKYGIDYQLIKSKTIRSTRPRINRRA